ncbi:hypothetical protein LUX34_19825 [Streptomyces werraensis]|nr:hypothetical protein [Streptomyces werraensis]
MEKEEFPAAGAPAAPGARERQQRHPEEGDDVPFPEGEPAESVEECGHEGVLPVSRECFRARWISPTT